MLKKIFILVGHPDNESESVNFAEHYAKGAREAGYEVRMTKLGDLKFDPILHKGYKVIQDYEPDLKKVQEDMTWADHYVIIHPIWWGGMPALFRGFFERIWMPRFAFQFHKEGLFKGVLWDKLLKKKTARIVISMDNWPIVAKFQFGDTTHELKSCILGFAGVRAKVTSIGGMKFMSEAKRHRWEEYLYRMGKQGK